MIRQRLFFGVAGLVFLLDVVLAAPGLTWLDGGEFVATVGPMGVSHPPGQPAYMVLAKLASLIPVGELAFRLSLFSAACSALSAGLLAAIVSRGAARLARLPGELPLAGLIAGLLLGVSPALSMQGVRPELYALALCLGLLAVAAIQLGGRRGVALAVLPLCVVGAVHHAMLVAAIPGFALLALGRGRGSLRAGLVTTALLLPFGLGQFAWLPLRSATLPPFDFGSPRTFDRVVHAVTGAGYARSFRLDGGMLMGNLGEHVRLALDDLGWLALVGAVLAAVLLFRAGRIGAVLVGATFVAVGVLPTVMQGVFSPDNPDAHGYLLGPIAVLSAGAGFATWALTDAVRRRSGLAPVLATTVLLGLVLPPLASTVLRADRRSLRAPRILGAAVLDQSPPGAVLLLGGDSWLFPSLAARYQEQRRPDVTVLGLHMLEPGMVADARARGVALPDVPQSVQAPRGLLAEFTLLAMAEAGFAVPVMVNDFFLPPSLLARRRPAGLLHQIAGPLDPAPPTEADVVTSIDKVLWGPGWGQDSAGQEVLARRHMARGGYHLQRGDAEGALALYGRGSAITADPWSMVHLARYRLEEGADRAGPWPADAQVQQAAEAMLSGDLGEAVVLVNAVLAGQPTHPGGLLLSERLYSLGHFAQTEAAAP